MSVPASTDSAADARRDSVANTKLEVVAPAVSDVDRARSFYEKLGWRLDADFTTGEDFRVGRVPGPAPEHTDYGSFAFFGDPDGNGWVLQEIKTRLPRRATGATFESAAAGEGLPS